MLNNTITAIILSILLCACASSKGTHTGTVAQSTSTTPAAPADTNKHKADLSKVPVKSTHEILYDK